MPEIEVAHEAPTGDHAENPARCLPCRTVFTAGQTGFRADGSSPA